MMDSDKGVVFVRFWARLATAFPLLSFVDELDDEALRTRIETDCEEWAEESRQSLDAYLDSQLPGGGRREWLNPTLFNEEPARQGGTPWASDWQVAGDGDWALVEWDGKSLQYPKNLTSMILEARGWRLPDDGELGNGCPQTYHLARLFFAAVPLVTMPSLQGAQCIAKLLSEFVGKLGSAYRQTYRGTITASIGAADLSDMTSAARLSARLKMESLARQREPGGWQMHSNTIALYLEANSLKAKAATPNVGPEEPDDGGDGPNRVDPGLVSWAALSGPEKLRLVKKTARAMKNRSVVGVAKKVASLSAGLSFETVRTFIKRADVDGVPMNTWIKQLD